MFEGLLGPEKVAMVLGIALFVLLLVILVVNLIRKVSLALPGILMVLPVVMILWPTIGSIEYADGKLTVKRLTDAVAANPGDTMAQKQLAAAITKIEHRVPISRRSLIDGARAVLHEGEAATLNLRAGRALTGGNSVPTTRMDSIRAAIDRKIAEVDTNQLTSSGRQQFRELRNWQEIAKTESLARVVTNDPGNTAAAQKLAAQRGGLMNLTLTPQQLTVRSRLAGQ